MGKVNDYALKFVINVPAQMSELHFTWISLSSPVCLFLLIFCCFCLIFDKLRDYIEIHVRTDAIFDWSQC